MRSIWSENTGIAMKGRGVLTLSNSLQTIWFEKNFWNICNRIGKKKLVTIKSVSVSWWKCEEFDFVKVLKCERIVRVWECEHVKVWGCESVILWGCESVKVSHCESLRLWKCVSLRVWKCVSFVKFFENIKTVENIENVEDTENVENVESVYNVEKVENVQNVKKLKKCWKYWKVTSQHPKIY